MQAVIGDYISLDGSLSCVAAPVSHRDLTGDCGASLTLIETTSIMRHSLLFAALGLTAAAPAIAANGFDDWPTKVTFSDGTTLAAVGTYQYDWNTFSNDNSRLLKNNHTFRRKEFGVHLNKDGVYDAMVGFDFQSKQWLDVFFGVETKALFGNNYGHVRVGYIKVLGGLEALTSGAAGSFMEAALPVQAIYQGRRTGAEWTFEQPQYLLQAAVYGGKDLQGHNPGTTQAVHAAWTPFKAEGDVLHLGLVYSQENPRGYHNGLNVSFSPSVRLNTPPEVALTPVSLIDSGILTDVDQIRRTVLEALWIKGPFSLQGEALRADVTRTNSLPNYSADGQYVFASYVLTGESRPYSAGNVDMVKPANAYGAVEVLARYSRLDLDDGNVFGGRQHDWTFGANWYLTNHFKFQLNYVRANAERAGVQFKPNSVDVRAQVQF